MDGVSAVLLQYGIAGVGLLAEAFVIARLYSDGKAKDLKYDALQGRYDEIQEARRLDAKETTDRVIAPLQGISQTITLVYDKLKTSKEQ